MLTADLVRIARSRLLARIAAGEAPDHELVWGDHCLLEALARWQRP